MKSFHINTCNWEPLFQLLILVLLLNHGYKLSHLFPYWWTLFSKMLQWINLHISLWTFITDSRKYIFQWHCEDITLIFPTLFLNLNCQNCLCSKFSINVFFTVIQVLQLLYGAYAILSISWCAFLCCIFFLLCTQIILQSLLRHMF